jgi:hypothetical protein
MHGTCGWATGLHTRCWCLCRRGSPARARSRRLARWILKTPRRHCYGALPPADPAIDRSGHVFLNYDPGRYNGVAILAPNAGGMADFDTLFTNGTTGGRFYSASLVDEDGDGTYEVRSEFNTCNPNCAAANYVNTTYRWDGSAVLQARHPGGPCPPPDAAAALETAADAVAAAYADAADAVAAGGSPTAGTGPALGRRLDEAAAPAASGEREAALRIVDGWGWLHSLADDLDRLERAFVTAPVTAPNAGRP